MDYPKQVIDSMFVDILGNTLLLSGACCDGGDDYQLDCANDYIKKYGDILKDTINTVRDRRGNTPLHNALGSKYRLNSGYYKKLLRVGANPNVCNSNGETALYYAIRLGDTKYVKRLLKYGANPNVKNSKDVSQLDMLLVNSYVDTQIVKLLLDAILYD